MLATTQTVILQRVQNMGLVRWAVDGGTGGQVQFSPKTREWEEAQYPEPSTSWGLDLAYRTPDEIWVMAAAVICYVVSMVARLGKRP